MVDPLFIVSRREKPDSKGIGSTASIDYKSDRIPIGPDDVISMHRHGGGKTALRMPDDDGKYAGDVSVSRRIKEFIGEAHGLVKKLFVIHVGIVCDRLGIGHSDFPRGCNDSIVGRVTCNRIQFVLNEVEPA